MFVFHPSLWFCTILFHLCKLCEIVNLFLRLGHFMLCGCSSKYVQFHSPLMVWKKYDIWWDWVPHERGIILLGGLYHLSPLKKTWHWMNWVPYGRSIILLGGGLCHLSPPQKTWHLVDWVPHGRSIILPEGNYIPFIPQENIVFGKAKSLVERDIILPRGRLG